MTSGLVSGERRWATARRSGMTVLGKVAVPKPINLPSQRLENHGLGPNVDIVPKGTHSWGSKPSPSTSNAWGSSALSPNADGGTVSPSHLSGHLSSGGSGTRPSTAGSDKAHEPVSSAWGSNSRPSSASGSVASNQASLTSFRPHSAETRPGSSQLSRFAEHLPDSSVPWAASGTMEKLGVISSKNEFSLSSGDFPTLGSEKESPASTAETQADTTSTANVKVESGHPWRRDSFPSSEEGIRPGMEKQHADNQLYPNASIPPHHYDGWRGGPPVNNHGGGWYRGPPGGPPFAPPVLSGGFPMEPFPYYHPQIPPSALANPQTVPPPGAGPRGPPSKNGDIYRPHMHDSYMRPGMPLRPGFYPAPVPYEGYYGPPMNFHNSNERDIPFIGMPVPPASYNRFASQNAPDPGHSHGRSGGYGPTGKEKVSEQLEPGHPRDAQGPYRVLMKHLDGWEGNDEGQKLDDSMIPKSAYHAKVDHPSKSSLENNDWRSVDRKDREMVAGRMAQSEETFSESIYDKEGVPVQLKSSDGMGILRTPNGNTVKKPLRAELAASAFPEASASPKDSGLIRKIESLNAKARSSDVRQDVKSDSGKEEQKNKLQTGNAMYKQSANEANTVTVSFEQTHVGGIVDTHEDDSSGADKNFELTGASGTATTRRSTRSIGGADHHGKGRFSAQDAEGWRKRSHVADSSSATSSLLSGSSSVHRQDHASAAAAEMSRPGHSGRSDEGSMSHNSETTDSQSQRAKMKELAKQRLKQREKEEEERIRDQKAKALAKLEELNRRTQIGEAVTQKEETSASAVAENKQEISSLIEIDNKSRTATSAASATSSAVGGSRATGVDKPTALSSEGQKVTLKATNIKSDEMHDQSRPLQQDIRIADVANQSNVVVVHDTNASKQKHAGYRQKQSTPLGNNSEEKMTPSTVDALEHATDVATNATVSLEGVTNGLALNSESSLPVSPSVIVESSVHHKKKNRGGKNKNKVESSSSTALPLMVSKDSTALDNPVDGGKLEISESASDPSIVQSSSNSKDANVVLEKHLPMADEEIRSRANSQWKPQHPRRMPRNPQANKSTEKSYNSDAVIWAPVRPQNKAEGGDETNQKSVVEVTSSSLKSDQQLQNNPKNRRAEIERYVPKPVAKEMAQQGSGHQPVASTGNHSAADEAVVKGESANVTAGSFRAVTTGMGKEVSESRNGDGRQNKAGKGHGAWRQRGSTEDSFSSIPGRNVRNTTEPCQPQNPNAISGKEHSSSSDEWNAHDGWNMPEHRDAPFNISVKDQSVMVKGKRQLQKGHRGLGYNNDPDEKGVTRLDFGKVNAPSSTSEMHLAELPATAKDNPAAVERSQSHWQPKSQVHSNPNQRGNRAANSGRSFGPEIGSDNKRRNSPSTGALLPTPLDEESETVKMKSYHDQAVSEKSNLEEASNDGSHHESKRERKTAWGKGRPGSPGEPSSDADLQNDKRPSSGSRKNGNQISRFGKEPESHAHWGGSGKDKKQHIGPANRERQRHNSHYEYQPVGPHSVNKANSLEAPKDSSYNSVSRFRERSNSQSQSMQGGGNFYRRQTGSVQVDASYD